MADEHAPKKRRTWIVVLALALVAALAAVGIVLAQGSDGDGDSDSDSDADNSSSDSRRPPGEYIDGTGYAYSIPEGWKDITSTALDADLPEGVDTVSGRGTSFQTSSATIIVERFEVEAGTAAEDVEKSWEENLTTGRGLKATYVPSLDVDGVPALGRQIRRKVVGGSDDILQVAYLVVHEGFGYSIGLNSAEGDTNAGASFDGVIQSWLWDDAE